MKPNFALNLSHEGITLSHLSPRGSWTEVGQVALDDPDLRENLSFLRSTAVGLEGKGFGSKLVLPNSQILYLEVDAPGPGHAERLTQIVAELDGKTPYAVADLTFDWIKSGAKVRVAVVANETLDEAEEFAVEHRFNPISFTAQTESEADKWEPFFGRTDYSFTFIAADVDVRDTPINTQDADPSLFTDDTDLDLAEEEPSQDLPDAIPSDEVESDTGNGANFFNEGQQDPSGENIFSPEPAKSELASEPDAASQPPADDVPPKEPTSLKADAPVTALTSRRQGVPDDTAKDRPITRVASRITITDSDTAETSAAPPLTAPSPDTADDTEIIADEQLRASFLADDADGTKPSISSILARFSPILVGLTRRGRGAVTWVANKAIAARANLTARLEQRRINKQTAKPETAPAVAALDPVAPDPLAEKPKASFLSSAMASSGQRRRLVVNVAATLALLGLLGLTYSFLTLGSDKNASGDPGTVTSENASLITTAPERGVRADNRARARPSDIAVIVAASTSPGEAEVPLVPIRPQRRSVFEGQIDPDADLPDTAIPVTDLSKQELADIRAAGLAPPTQEEIAEDGDRPQLPQMDQVELDAAYAKSGILQGLNNLARQSNEQLRDDIFVAAVDRALQANDAIILPDFNNGVEDDPPKKRLSPLAPNMVFDLDDRGFVKPTVDGAFNPDGILVHLGKPAVTPPTKPKTEVLVPPNPLLTQRPKARPDDLKTGEDAVFVQGRLTIAQLRTRKAKHRPVSEQSALTGQATSSPTELAVLTSFQPAKRPSNFDETVEKARVKIASVAPTTGNTTAPSVTTGPVLPTRANVAKTATIKNAINLAKLNLIGVYGSTSKREALLRLPSGRFVRVKIGDRIDGGRVAAIGTNSLSYVKSGRNRVLKIPQ
jgi:hypothetical protein